MGASQNYIDHDCYILPDIEKEGLDGSFQKPNQVTTSEDEKLPAALNSTISEGAAENKQHADPAVAEILEDLGLMLAVDDYVKWRTDASAHPRNWTSTRKAFDTGLVLLLDLFTWVNKSQLLSFNAKFRQNRH